MDQSSVSQATDGEPKLDSHGETSDLIWDLRLLEYISEVDENLVCPICHCPFISPISLQCQHIFCKDCLFEALNHQEDIKSCPTCRGPFDLDLIVVVPKVIDRILEELLVKCPQSSKGCPEALPRGSVQTHLDRYCGYQSVPCPSDECNQFISRRLAGDSCLHTLEHCQYCSEELSSMEILSHQDEYCSAVEDECSDCKVVFSRKSYKQHREVCTEMTIQCCASEYGCDFTGKRKESKTHETLCPMAKLSPFIALQNAKLEEHAQALRRLQRKTLLHETFLDTIKDTLATVPSADPCNSPTSSDPTPLTNPPFDSPSSHLLSLHETLREEVARVSAAVSDLDAKTDTAFLNSSLRAKEETAHRDAVITQLRVQVQWLVSSRLQGMHTARMSGNILGTETRPASQSEDAAPGPSKLPALTRRGSDGLGIGGREKL